MKKLNGTLLVLALTLGAFLGASAQQKPQANTFDENDLYALQGAADSKLKGKIYRLTAIDTDYDDGSATPTRTEKNIEESVPPDRFHSITEMTTAKGTQRLEMISVAGRTFFKHNDEEWKEPQSGSGYGSGSGSGNSVSDERIQIEDTTERRLKKGETVNNQTVDLYETVHTVRYKYLSNVYSIISKTSYWFDKNGLLVKSAGEDENTETKRIYRSTKEYEYDPNIKIEAPIKDAPAAKP